MRLLFLLLFFSSSAFGQLRKDSTNKRLDIQKQTHNRILEDLTEEKYQMVYVDKYIIDKKNHKIYIFSSYDLWWGDESGVGMQLSVPNKKKATHTQTYKARPSYWR